MLTRAKAKLIKNSKDNKTDKNQEDSQSSQGENIEDSQSSEEEVAPLLPGPVMADAQEPPPAAVPADAGDNADAPDDGHPPILQPADVGIAQAPPPTPGIVPPVPPVPSPAHLPIPAGMVPYKITPFSGTQGEDAAEFLTDFCEYARLYHLTNVQTKNLFIMCLRERAKRWFRQSFPNPEGSSCEAIFEQFKLEFYTSGIDWEREISYDSLRQLHIETVHAYALRVEKLATKLGKSDITMLQTFVRGLLPTYKRTVLSRGPTSFAEALKIATLLESAEVVTNDTTGQDQARFSYNELSAQVQEVYELLKDRERQQQTAPQESQAVSSKNISSFGEKSVVIKCFYCNKTGHTKAECRLKKKHEREKQERESMTQTKVVNANGIVCMWCGSNEHYAAKCMNVPDAFTGQGNGFASVVKRAVVGENKGEANTFGKSKGPSEKPKQDFQ